jgi:hypothetical protein
MLLYADVKIALEASIRLATPCERPRRECRVEPASGRQGMADWLGAVACLVAEVKLRMGEAHQDHESIFCRAAGSPLDRGNVPKRVFLVHPLEDCEKISPANLRTAL